MVDGGCSITQNVDIVSYGILDYHYIMQCMMELYLLLVVIHVIEIKVIIMTTIYSKMHVLEDAHWGEKV